MSLPVAESIRSLPISTPPPLGIQEIDSGGISVREAPPNGASSVTWPLAVSHVTRFVPPPSPRNAASCEPSREKLRARTEQPSLGIGRSPIISPFSVLNTCSLLLNAHATNFPPGLSERNCGGAGGTGNCCTLLAVFVSQTWISPSLPRRPRSTSWLAALKPRIVGRPA